jgi:hypothetical protein
VALKEINKESDIKLQLEFVGAGNLSEGTELRFSNHGEKKSQTQAGGLNGMIPRAISEAFWAVLEWVVVLGGCLAAAGGVRLRR